MVVLDPQVCHVSTWIKFQGCIRRKRAGEPPARLLSSFLVKGLFFPSGPFSLIDVRSFLLLAQFSFLLSFIMWMNLVQVSPFSDVMLTQ